MFHLLIKEVVFKLLCSNYLMECNNLNKKFARTNCVYLKAYQRFSINFVREFIFIDPSSLGVQKVCSTYIINVLKPVSEILKNMCEEVGLSLS